MAEKTLLKEDLFVEDHEGVKLLAGKCNACGQIHFPKVESCLNCFHEDLNGITLSRRGKLYSFTITHMASMHFQPPYAVGYVDLPEGIRIFTPLDIIDEKPFKVGMEMEVHLDTLWVEGEKDVVGFRFSPL